MPERGRPRGEEIRLTSEPYERPTEDQESAMRQWRELTGEPYLNLRQDAQIELRPSWGELALELYPTLTEMMSEAQAQRQANPVQNEPTFIYSQEFVRAEDLETNSNTYYGTTMTYSVNDDFWTNMLAAPGPSSNVRLTEPKLKPRHRGLPK